MAAVGTITLYREKASVYRVDTLDEGETEEALMVLCSNRVTIPVKLHKAEKRLIVRGQNIPATLRLVSVVLEVYRRDSDKLFSGGGVDWESKWSTVQSPYDRDFNEESWVSIHMDGETLFTTRSDNDFSEIERLAMGSDIDESVIQEASGNIMGEIDDLVVQYDSQTAYVITPFASYHRAAILDRRAGKTGSYAISVYHDSAAKPVRLAYFINFCADISETMNLNMFLSRLQSMIANNTLGNMRVTANQVAGAKHRKKDMLHAINQFERAHKVTYRPERPAFM